MVLKCQNAFIDRQVIKKNQIKFGDMNINLEKFKQSFNKLGTNKNLGSQETTTSIVSKLEQFNVLNTVAVTVVVTVGATIVV